IAAALLHPDVSSRVVERFHGCGVEIVVRDRLEGPADCSAALIFGGDGTVHRHLAQLYARKIPVLVVPAGSGNDFAKALGIFSVEDAVTAWRQFCAGGNNVREIDLGVIRPGKAGRGVRPTSNAAPSSSSESSSDSASSAGSASNSGSASSAGSAPSSGSALSCESGSEASAEPRAKASDEEILFCCVAGIGMDADANALANRMPGWLKGRGGYLLAALRSLIAFEPVEMSVAAEGREIRRAALFIAVGNAHRYGGGMKITPQAAPDDGLLDICFVGRINKLKLLCWVPTIFFGGHLGLAGLEYFRARAMRIETGRALQVYADGDWACRTPVELGVRTRALKVIGPAGKGGQR